MTDQLLNQTDLRGEKWLVSSVLLLAIKRLIYYIVYLGFSLLREEIVKDTVCLKKSTVFLDISFTNIAITLIPVCVYANMQMFSLYW